MDQHSEARDPEAAFQRLAVDADLLPPGALLTPALRAFAFGIVELCASVGDRYSEGIEGHAGEHIRALYGEG